MTIRSRSSLFLLAFVTLGAAASLALAVPPQTSQQFLLASSLLPPVGSIVAWHPELVGTPVLPATWEPCDGQMITDAQSPYFGVLLPDLNGEERYLRGSIVSGVLQADSTAVNGLSASTGIAGNHFHSMGSAGLHTHSRTDVGGIGSTRGFAAAANQSGSTSTSADGLHTHSISSAGDHAHSVVLAGDTETRPVTMSVVWIMRIR